MRNDYAIATRSSRSRTTQSITGTTGNRIHLGTRIRVVVFAGVCILDPDGGGACLETPLAAVLRSYQHSAAVGRGLGICKHEWVICYDGSFGV